MLRSRETPYWQRQPVNNLWQEGRKPGIAAFLQIRRNRDENEWTPERRRLCIK